MPSTRHVTALVLVFLLAVPAATAFAEAGCAPARVPLDAPTALVLSGGGAKGAWEAGVAAMLLERGLPIRLVTGSSAGALNAALIADGRPGVLESSWRSITTAQVYSLRPAVVFAGLLPGWLTLMALDRAGSLLDPRPLRELLAASLDFDRIRRSPVEIRAVAMDLAQRQQRIFDNRTLTVDALMAATAVPGAFPPVVVDGNVLVDGGLTGRAPVLEALESGMRIERVIVAMSYQPDEHGTRPTTMRETLEQAFETSMIHQILRDTELARLKYPDADVQLLIPSAPLALRPLEFEAGGIARALTLGRADAAACLRRWGAE
jgi:NTE family protein